MRPSPTLPGVSARYQIDSRRSRDNATGQNAWSDRSAYTQSLTNMIQRYRNQMDGNLTPLFRNVLLCCFVFIPSKPAVLLAEDGSDQISSDSKEVQFNRDIRPILSEKCYFCHGPDEQARSAGLRLDVREDAISYGAIVPGQPESSTLISRVHSLDPAERMPPPESKLPPLTTEELVLLENWISSGANYEVHWAFQPVEHAKFRNEPNEISKPKNIVDHYVKKQHDALGFKFSAQAELTTLARRASFDVIGLPPPSALLKKLLADSKASGGREQAWLEYIDSLLDSPHYGERMAMDWLDIARYADSFGFQVDRDIDVWQWRDWVIQAFNENKPFDQFIVEQIAGDMLPNPTTNQILATAFNRLHQQESEGGSVEEEYRVEYVADRVNTYGTAFLGLTLECARCHDHKFDPISQKEYYQLFSFFQNIEEAGLYSYFTMSPPTPTLAFSSKEQESKLKELEIEISQLRNQMLNAIKEQIAENASLKEPASNSQSELNREPVPSSIQPRDPSYYLNFDAMVDGKISNLQAEESFATVHGENQLVDGISGKAIQLTGDDPIKTTVGNFGRHEPFSLSIWINTPDPKERAVILHRSRAWTDAASRGYELLIEDGKIKWSLIHFWPGNAISVRTKTSVATKEWTHVAVSYDGSSQARGLSIYINGQAEELDILNDSLTKEITGGGYDFIDLGERFRDRGFTGGLIDEFQLFPHEITAFEANLLWSRNASPQDSQIENLRIEHDAILSESVVNLTQQILQLEKAKYAIQDSLIEIMAMKEMAMPKPAYILERGEYSSRGEQVHPEIPAALGKLDSKYPKSRLGLAQWTVAPENPLTSRVIVNRFWQSIFGAGLVRTPEDFGSQGSKPTNPELLDALASQFVTSGWNTKELLRMILTSQTYQQTSDATEEAREQDPENIFLARGPRFRLPAEMIRDNALASSGLMNAKIGGPSVVTYELLDSFKPSTLEDNQDRYRRSLYTKWRRTGPPPALLAFDAPRRAVCVPKRERTNTPLQALILLNNPQYLEAAIKLGDTLIDQHGTDTERLVESAFLVCLGRIPTMEERQISEKLLHEQNDLFEQAPDDLRQLISVGAYKPRFAETHGFAGAIILCHTLFCHDGAIIKR